jgi:hypothetical protein
MYNSSFKCTYHTIQNEKISDTTYQNELLCALGFTKYTDEICDTIELICDQLDHKQEIISKLLIPQMMILFSYDYFHLMHDYLCDVFQKKDTTQSYQNLLVALIK